MPKNLVLFSDGTGNSSGKLFKPNVWRLYEAVDLADPQDPEQPRQFAYYDDGVGTSSFKPLAVLGGAFGVGLARNVLDLYVFLCRMYEPGDHIYAFGFSRGAFTIRVLAGGAVLRLGAASAAATAHRGRQKLVAVSKEYFDVVMLDAYDDRSIPAALMDAEFFAIVAARLAPGGVVMQNVYTPIVDTKRLLAAMHASFAQVDFYKVGDSAVLAAYQGPAREPSQLMTRAQQLDASLRPVHSLGELLTPRLRTF